MLGCDVDGFKCKVGCSTGDPGGGLVNTGYEGTGYTVPLDTKFEFTFAHETNPDPAWKVDSFNTSAVDGMTLPYTLEYYDATNKETRVISCSMPDFACPGAEPVKDSCMTQSADCKVTSEISLKYENKDGEYLGCKSPCTHMVKGGYNSKPSHQGKDGLFPGPKMYCCPGDKVSSKECNTGPVNLSEYCKAIHRRCITVKSPNPSDVGKAAVYCQAFDDEKGLIGIPCGQDNRIKVTFSDWGFEGVA
jgi:hypothetical protein